MDLKKVKVVASYEARAICRSFLFWVLVTLTIGGITLLQWLVQGKVTAWGWSWLMHHQTFSFPLVNAYLYNIVQSFIVIFVWVNLFTREQRGGMLESLHARSVSNGEYFLGKTVGIIFVLLAVGFFSLLACCGINIWGSQAPFNPLYYLYYFLTLTVPSLIFFTGFALWMTWLARSRVLSAILLLIFLYCSVTILPGVFHGLFDFTGSSLSNIFSVATGHVDGWHYLLHRSAYLLAGVGFTYWAIRFCKRIPNEQRTIARCCYGGIALLFIGMLLGSIYARDFMQEKSARAEFRAAFDRHAGEKSCRVSRHDITLRQTGDRITSVSDLTLQNPNKEAVSRIVLYLNPGLTVKHIEERDKPLAFTRDGQAILIERSLAAGDSVRLSVRYSGVPDGRIAYLDSDDKSYYDTRRNNNFFHLGRRHVLASNTALVLVPEVMWYPVTIPPVNPSLPFLSGKDYTLYRLRVVAPVQPVVLSQGKPSRQGDTLLFSPSRPLEGVTLCAGNYEHRTISLQDIKVDWYYFKENDFVTPLIQQFDGEKILKQVETNILTSLGKVISFSIYAPEKEDHISDFILRRDWYTDEGGRLLLVETPLPFVSHARTWKGRSEYVQPGMVLLGERGIGMNMNAYAFFSRKNAKQEEEAIRLIRGSFLITNPFLDPSSLSNANNPFLERLNLKKARLSPSFVLNPYCCLPMFTEPAVTIVSSRYRTIDRILKQFIAKGEHYPKAANTIIIYNSDLAAHVYLQDHTLEEALQDRSIPSYVLQQMMALKTGALLDRVAVHVPQKKFYRFLRSFYTAYQGEIPLDTLCQVIRSELEFDFEQVLQAWDSQAVTNFRVQNLKNERVEQEYGSGWMARFQIWNTGEHPGFIVYSFSHEGSYHLWLQPGECKEVRLHGSSNMFTLDLGISRNLPSVMQTTETGTTRDTREGIKDISPSVFIPQNGEIIVDNEDPGFRLIFPGNNRSKFFSEKSSGGEMILTGPWQKEFRGNAYGNEYKSIYLKRAGNGSCKAEWSADIPEDGIYEILAMHPEAWSPQKAQYYTVKGEGLKSEEILLPWEKGRWASLGEFELKRGKSFVILDDRAPVKKEEEKDKRHTPLKSIVADAVKWVKIKDK
ncbi:ABC transporter permease [Gabonibacter massiliensis]|uniref:golvesin C-terminal-like domain-containing protein n=1 Tax=Gabonibacter massiliensis TaxID=1720195 RepID=UPI00073F9D06|nr:ABC transporter permease [Gabonibacter massiliensis]